jgi:hypothetical protein
MKTMMELIQERIEKHTECMSQVGTFTITGTVGTVTGYKLDDRAVGVKVQVGSRIFTQPTIQ